MRRAWLAAALGAAVLLALPAGAGARGRCGAHPWCDTSLPAARRAALLVEALTPAERIGLLGGDSAGGVLGHADTHTGDADGVPRLDVPPLRLTDGPVGVRQGAGTAFPASIALAASFDRALARTYGAAVAGEAKLKGNDVVYAPTVNILRTPLWGRAFESFGEDPFLTARLGVDWIRGAQRQGVIANVKHFAVNNQEGAQPTGGGAIVGNRFTVDAKVDERTLREIYLPQFEAAVEEAKVGSIMCAYNRVNGVHACENPALLTRILRREWGFRGFVLADYGASKHIGPALRAGLDFEPWPFGDTDGGQNLTPTAIQAALAAGTTTQAEVDAAVRRLLGGLFAAGFFDRAGYVNDPSRIDAAAHERTAQRVAEAGTVLLRNRGALPLDARRLRSLAVIGSDADRYVAGGGSSDVMPSRFTSPLAAIRARAGAGVEVRSDPGDDAARAAQVARGAGAAVVVVADTAGEGVDKPCLGLDCGAKDELRRDALIEAVAAANPRTIVVLETAGPVLTPWRDRVAGILEAWYPGEAAGPAIARVLFGDVDPGGRLPATFPRREADLPTAGDPAAYPGVGDVVTYKEGVLVGYRSYDARRLPTAFPFGFGLSYTRFTLRDVRVRAARRGTAARVSVEVVNRGPRRGTAVPQLYLGVPSVRGRVEPPRRLEGFTRVALRPGRSTRASFALDRRAFSHWDIRAHAWRVDRGCYGLWVGSSSRDLGPRTRLAVGGARCGRGAVAVPGGG